MSDATKVASQAEAVSESQVDTTNQQPESQADKVQNVSLEDMKKVRSEAANLRKRLRDAEEKVSQFETANQSEDERRSAELQSLQERADVAERALRVANGRTAVFSKAGNAVSQEALYRFVRDDIEFDDDGSPANIDELVAQARKSEPSLFQRGSADGSPRETGNTGKDFNSAFRELAKQK